MLSLVLADLMDGHDVHMLQIGGCFGFRMKPLDVLCGGQLSGQDHLDGHDPVEARLSGFVDHPHSAAGNLFEQFVVAEKRRTLGWLLLVRRWLIAATLALVLLTAATIIHVVTNKGTLVIESDDSVAETRPTSSIPSCRRNSPR